MEMCRWLFQGFIEIQNGRQRATLIFGGAQKLKKFVWLIFFEILKSHFSNTEMCKWFFKVATKIQNGRQRSTPNFFVGAKTQTQKVGNYSNFTITFPTIWRCASDFFKVLLKFKMAAMHKLHICLWVKNRKIEVSNNSHCTITLPTIWKCAGDFTENLKWPPNQLCKYLWPLIYGGGGWYRTSGLLLYSHKR